MSAQAKRLALLGFFREALARLQDALSQPKTEFLRDASIQRFELAFEMFWKTLKAVAEESGLQPVAPRDSLRAGFSLGVLDEDAAFFRMIEDRNLTSHAYRLEMAERIYSRLPQYAALMADCLGRIEARLREG